MVVEEVKEVKMVSKSDDMMATAGLNALAANTNGEGVEEARTRKQLSLIHI